MKRIAIVGCAGAGKSWLAVRLGAILGLEVIHLDAHFWNPGWVETPLDEWIKLQDELVEKPEWIIDGNYAGTAMVRFYAADTIIFLDYPRRLCLWRGLMRIVHNYGNIRPDLGPGCPEKFDWEFIKWIWRFPGKSRRMTVSAIEAFRGKREIYWFRKPGEMMKFLDSLTEEHPRAT